MASKPTDMEEGGKNGEKQRLISSKPPLPSKPQVSDDDDNGKGNILIISFFLMLFFALGNRIFGRLQVYPMHNYPLFINLIQVVVYVPVCFAYIIPMVLFTNSISKEQRDIPKYKFAIMGCYDSLAGLLSVFAVNYITSSSTIVLVQQSAIPISMIVSSITLGSKYTKAQYTGASIVMLGIIAVLLPTFFSHHAAGAEATAAQVTAAASEANMQLVWIAVLVVSCVPMCLSSVYKEKALGEVEIDCTYLNGWVAVFQFLIALPLCLPSAQIQGMPVSNIPANMYGGMACWFGYNTITEDYNPFNQPLDSCESAPLFVNAYLAFNVIYNFLIVVILKHGSANIMWMASTVIVPLSNVAFSLKFMPGSQPMGPMDLVGLVIIMSGLVVYRFSNQLVELWESVSGTIPDQEEVYKRQNVRKLTKQLESKQAKYVGLNQIESLQTLMDTRVMKAQMQTLFRSPRMIRENYLFKIGVSPSPRTTGTPSPLLASPSRRGVGANNGAASTMSYLLHPNPPKRSFSIAEGKTVPGVAMTSINNSNSSSISGTNISNNNRGIGVNKNGNIVSGGSNGTYQNKDISNV